MKTFILTVTLCLLSIGGAAQVFQFFSSDGLTNPPSDSRSVNFVDVNGDDLDDLFISNGPEGGAPDFLYLNEEGTQLSLQEDQPFYLNVKPSVGATFADVDNDGDLDASVTSWYGVTNGFYLNDGTGQFISPLGTPLNQTNTYSESAAWGDFNKDGWLDLFVTNSGGADRSNSLYQQTQAGSFEPRPSVNWSLPNNYSRSVSWIDYDSDDDLDLYVTNENAQPNELYINQGDDTFIRAENLPILENTGSTITHSWGDIDNDGDVDLFLGNAGYFQPQASKLFRNLGNGEFELVANSVLSNLSRCTFGSAFGDIDNDADLDLVLTSGYCTPDELGAQLFLNDGNGHFTLADSDYWPELPQVCSYGTAMGDLNNDGFLDIAIAHCKNNSASPAPPNSILLNTPNDNNWLKVKLIGNASNRSAIGARVEMIALISGAPVFQQRRVSAQTGYAGQNSLTVHFGLSEEASGVWLIIVWPDGKIQTVNNLEINQTATIEEPEPVSTASDNSLNRITISPNPVSSMGAGLRIFQQDKQPLPDFEVRIFDNTGKVVFKKHFDGTTQNDINISWPYAHTPDGSFYVQIWDQKKLYRVFPIVKVD